MNRRPKPATQDRELMLPPDERSPVPSMIPRQGRGQWLRPRRRGGIHGQARRWALSQRSIAFEDGHTEPTIVNPWGRRHFSRLRSEAGEHCLLEEAGDELDAAADAGFVEHAAQVRLDSVF